VTDTTYVTRQAPRRSVGSPAVLIPLVVVLALVGGVAAAFGSVLLVGVLAALLVGGGLMMNPRVHLLVGLVFAMVITGVLEFFFFFGQANWLSSIIIGSMLITGISRSVWENNLHPGPTLFGFSIYAYLLTLMFSSAVNNIPIVQAIVGLRNYVPYIGIAAILVYVNFDSKFIRQLPILLLAIGFLQAPVALIQNFVVGPWRNSLRNAVGRVDEAIVGTFGGSVVTGGYTGEMAAFLVMLIIFVLARRRDKIIGSFAAAASCAILLIPILFAETKVSLVLLPLLIFVCFIGNIRSHKGFVSSLVVVAVVLIGAVAATYFYRYWNDSAVAVKQMGYAFDPNFMVTPTHRGRVGTIIHWYESNVAAGHLMGTMFGYGMASTLEGSFTIGLGSAVKRFGLGLDAHAMSRLLWDGGLICFAIFLVIGIRTFLVAWRLSINRNTPIEDRSILTFAAGGALAMIFMLPYQMSVLGGSAMQFLFWFVVGLVEVHRRRLQKIINEPS
jgi:hypothetical protein